MRTLFVIFVIALVSMVANAQTVNTIQFDDNQAGVTEYYSDSISLQQGCVDCPKSYKLYDAVRFTFFGGEIITMTEFRRVAALVGETVGIRYDKSSRDNQRILHARLSRAQYELILASVTGEVAPAKEEISVPMVGTVRTTPSTQCSGCDYEVSKKVLEYYGSGEYMNNIRKEEERAERIEREFEAAVNRLDTTVVVRPYYVSDVKPLVAQDIDFSVSQNMFFREVELLPPFLEHEILIDIYARWNTCNQAIDFRKARFAILMAHKYGGYKDAPVSYGDGLFNITSRQDKFCYRDGDKIPFLGWSEGAYKKYYEWEAPKKENSITNRKSKPTGIPLSKISGSRRLKGAALVAASHRACRKRG